MPDLLIYRRATSPSWLFPSFLSRMPESAFHCSAEREEA